MHAASVVRLLASDTKPSISRYAIVDCAATAGFEDDDEILKRLSHPDVEKQILFTGENAQAIDHVAPYLLPLDSQPELEEWLLENGWGNGWAIFFTSDAGTKTLLAHFRTFFELQAPNGRDTFFRFYAPPILGDFLSLLNAQEALAFFGPVQRLVIETGQGEPAVFDRPQGRLTDQLIEKTDPSKIVFAKREQFSKRWRARLLGRHVKAYGHLGFHVTANAADNALTIQDKAGATARLQKTKTGVEITTGEQRKFQYELTTCNHPAAIVDPAGNRIEWDIQERDNQEKRSVIPMLNAIRMEAGAKTWVFDYGDMEYLERIDYPDGTSTSIRHDSYGNLAGVVDRNGHTTGYEYDFDQRLTNFKDANGHTTRFDYEDLTAPSTIAFADGQSFNFEYTDAGALKKFLSGNTGVASYDVDTDSGSWTVNYTDGGQAEFVIQDGKIIKAANAAGTVELAYDDAGHLIKETFRNRSVTYHRNPTGQLTGITTPFGQTIHYRLDGENRVCAIKDWTGRTIDIQYALNGALERITYPNGTRLEQQTNAQGSRLADNTTQYTINAADRLTQAGPTPFAYDSLGNLTQGTCPLGRADYAYTDLNRLKTISLKNTSAQYLYDAFGRRVAKKVNGTTTRYYWAQSQLLHETQGSENAGQKTPSVTDYLFFPQTPVLLAIRQNSQIRWAAFGHRYEVLRLTNESGQVVWRARYDAFGNARVEIGEDIHQPFRLAGQYCDAESGLHYNLARYYDPSQGRFLCLDPLFLEGGSTNFYTYCNGDPINHIDPGGESIFCANLIGACVGGAIGTAFEGIRRHQPGEKTDGFKSATAVLNGGATSAIGGAAATPAGTAMGSSSLPAMADAGFLAGAGTSVAEQCAQAEMTGNGIDPLSIAKQALSDGGIGSGTALPAFGAGNFAARRLAEAAPLYRPRLPAERAAKLARKNKRLKSIQSPQAQKKTLQKRDHADKSMEGDPVNAVTGEVVLTQSDFVLPWRIPLSWSRHYGSQSHYCGLLGPGWQSPADARLELDADKMVTFYDGRPGGAVFEKLPTSAPVMEACDGAELSATKKHYQVQLKSGQTYHFAKTFTDNLSHVVKISDPSGNALYFDRQDAALTRICDSSGQSIEVTCHRGRITAMHLGQKPLVSYRYDDGRLIAAADALGRQKRFDYQNGRLVRHMDKNKLSFHYEYDDSGRCVHGWGDNGLYDYRFDHRIYESSVIVTNSLGHAKTYIYDQDKLPVKVRDHRGAEISYAYDEVGRVISVTDALQRTSAYRYDAAGNLLEIMRPDNNRMVLVYDDHHRPVQMCDANGKIREQRFDPKGRLIEKISPLNERTQYSYNRRGDLQTITDPQGRTTTFAYDRHGLISTVIDANNNPTHYQRDLSGNITAVIDAAGRTTRYLYDEKSRLIQAVRPSGASQSFNWDGEDNLLLYTDPNGLETRFAYGGLNEIIQRINADGTTVSYHYDSEEHLTGVTNEKGQTHRFEYDPAGRVTAQTDYWSHTSRYQYDAAGQLIQSIDPLGQTIAYEYDPAGRLLTKTFESQEREDFTWDANGNLTGFESPGAVVERFYDAANHLVAEKNGEFVIEYQYDKTGRRTGRTTSCGNRVQYRYDQTGALSAIRINDHAPVTMERDALGRITSEHFSQYLKRSLDYDDDGLLTRQSIHSAAGRIERRYQYDPAGNLTAKHDSRKGPWQFSHDPMGRITEALDPEHQLHRFGYDPAGDLLEHMPDIGHGPRCARYNHTEYRFDAAGNLAERQTQEALARFIWDEQNRLITVRKADDTRIDMTYDALGRRRIKAINGQRTFYHYDGDALLCEQFEDEAPREYVYYPGTFEPLAVIDGDGQVYYYHNDPNGLPQELTKPNGEIVWSASYDALGRVEQILVDEVAQPLRMQGQYYDEETGLCYNRHRYYDPQICSFLSQDPIGLAGGDNVYAYAPNVWGWVDPLGLACKAAAPDKVPGIKVLRKNIDPFGEDKYGHWWIEIDGNESYGWWPKEPVDLKGTLLGVEGELNGLTHFGGTKTRDPHHGDRSAGVNVFDVYSSQSKDDTVEAIRNFSNSYSGKWSWPTGQNCHSFQKKMLKDLGLSIK